MYGSALSVTYAVTEKKRRSCGWQRRRFERTSAADLTGVHSRVAGGVCSVEGTSEVPPLPRYSSRPEIRKALMPVPSRVIAGWATEGMRRSAGTVPGLSTVTYSRCRVPCDEEWPAVWRPPSPPCQTPAGAPERSVRYAGLIVVPAPRPDFLFAQRHAPYGPLIGMTRNARGSGAVQG